MNYLSLFPLNDISFKNDKFKSSTGTYSSIFSLNTIETSY